MLSTIAINPKINRDRSAVVCMSITIFFLLMSMHCLLGLESIFQPRLSSADDRMPVKSVCIYEFIYFYSMSVCLSAVAIFPVLFVMASRTLAKKKALFLSASVMTLN